MPYHTYPFELPPLPYAHAALHPYIDEETMRCHHDKHFQTYITNLNKTLEPYPKLQKLTLERLLTYSGILPYEAYVGIERNGGGVYNHGLFFEGLSKPSEEAHAPRGYLAALINRTFGDFDKFKECFGAAALDVFGSGWVCLGLTPLKRLKIYTLTNQETILKQGARPILIFDVWEHAYYLKYKNARAEYVEALWKVAKFPEMRFRAD
ncbi:MAG: superoxide dismutase [Clostridiales bacterium]|jgi:Fe-Mn family superoxide dismutase|nr:superoxide dismutase [Clostridiales bacterium]